MLLPGELEAVKQVIALADTYGYGNMIAHLKQQWAKKLMAGNERLNYKSALRATNVEAYPLDFDIEKLPPNKQGYPYQMGYDCAINGPNKTNCDLSLFATQTLTNEWERGKADGEASKAHRSTPKPA